MGDLDIAELATLDELERLRPEWTELWRRAPSVTPFQSPAWLIAWWRHFGGANLLALAFRDAGGQLVGMVPLFIYEQPAVRRVVPVGIGISDYFEGAFASGWAESCAAALFRYLAGTGERWDLCDFQELRPGSPLLTIPLPEGLDGEQIEQDICPVLRLPARPEHFREMVSPRFAYRLRYYWRRAAKMGELRVESARPDNLEELFEALLRLHGARWATRGLPGMLADDKVEAFHREAAPALLELGILRLYGIRLDGRFVAAIYGFLHGRSAYVYLTGFAPEFPQPGFGTMMLHHAVQEAIREKAEQISFLRGDEAYKYRWGATDTVNYTRIIRQAGPSRRAVR